ncbi:MAG: TIM barrel protein, partial [Planctomycetes bacterium]|nr:TIM barrel protein [Planctomycetota bacterium]
AAACGAPAARAATGPAAAPAAGDEPWFRISLAEWSLHRSLSAGEMTHLDFPLRTREEFGLEGCEYVNAFFKDKATDFAYLRELQRRCDDSGVRSLLIMIDGEGELGDADDAARRRAVDRHHRWIAAAAFLGCHSIRVNAGGGGAREELAARCSDSLHRLGEHGEDYRVDVIVENHGGPSSDGAWLAAVIRAASHPRVGTLPDFGNFTVEPGRAYDRYLGMQELLPFARAVSAKSYDFGADGNETTIDYARMLGLVQASGYRGWLGIEYEGQRLSEPDGIRATKALLQRLRG